MSAVISLSYTSGNLDGIQTMFFGLMISTVMWAVLKNEA